MAAQALVVGQPTVGNNMEQCAMVYVRSVPCYGPYISDGTSTKRELVLDQDQCAGSGTDGTSGAMG